MSPQRILFVRRLPFTLLSPFSVAPSLPDENGGAGTSSSGIYREVSRCTHEEHLERGVQHSWGARGLSRRACEVVYLPHSSSSGWGLDEAPGGRCDEGLAAAPAAYYPVVLGTVRRQFSPVSPQLSPPKAVLRLKPTLAWP